MSDSSNDSPLTTMLAEAMDGLPTTVLVTDGDLHIKYLNAAAKQLVGAQEPLQVVKRCGDALQCLNALQPGACCGETEECPDCVLRRTVVKACAEQTSLSARAYIRRDTAEGDRYVHSLVKASGFTHEGQTLVVVLLQDIPEILEAAGLLRLCAWCHKIADEDDRWVDLNEYLARDLSLQVSHGMCPDCAARLSKDAAKTPS